MAAKHARTGAYLFELLSLATEVRVQVRFGNANNWFKVSKDTAKEILHNAGIKPESIASLAGRAVPLGSLEEFGGEDQILYLNNEEGR